MPSLVLPDPLLPRLALVSRVWVGVLEVWVDVEGDEVERLEGRREHDGHVVRRVDGARGDVGPGGRPHVGETLLQAPFSVGKSASWVMASSYAQRKS